MEERTAAIALLRHQERVLNLLKREQEQAQEVVAGQQHQDDDRLKTLKTQDGRTMGNGSDLLFMDFYMRPTRSVGKL
eukprot:COSAG02_NODE_20191_length_843_cov_123.346774_2_plen_76_part_01